MPGLLTHYLFGEDIIDQIPDNTLKNILNNNRHAYDYGLQGPDLFFYDLVHLSMNHGSNLGSLLHEEHTSRFLTYMLLAANKLSNRQDKEIAIAYICGFIGHYSLDTHAHPYVYYMTDTNDYASYPKSKCMSDHIEFEGEIEVLLFDDRYHIPAHKLRRKAFMHLSAREMTTIAKVLSYSLKRTYGIKIPPYKIKGTIIRSTLVNRLLQDRTGIKKMFLHNVEKNTYGYYLASGMIFQYRLPKDRSVLNENHREWYCPVTCQKRTDSFMDLYKSGLLFNLSVFKAVNKYLEHDSSLKQLSRRFGNLSYHTGTPCDGDCKMKYFKKTM